MTDTREQRAAAILREECAWICSETWKADILRAMVRFADAEKNEQPGADSPPTGQPQTSVVAARSSELAAAARTCAPPASPALDREALDSMAELIGDLYVGAESSEKCPRAHEATRRKLTELVSSVTAELVRERDEAREAYYKLGFDSGRYSAVQSARAEEREACATWKRAAEYWHGEAHRLQGKLIASAAQPAKEEASVEVRSGDMSHDGVAVWRHPQSTPPAPTDAEVLERAAEILLPRRLHGERDEAVKVLRANASLIRSETQPRIKPTTTVVNNPNAANPIVYDWSAPDTIGAARSAPAEEPKAIGPRQTFTPTAGATLLPEDAPRNMNLIGLPPAPPAASEPDVFEAFARHRAVRSDTLAPIAREWFGECVKALEFYAADLVYGDVARSALSSLRARRGGHG